MFYSQLLLSKKGALGIVWMAAHCFKRLKKDQVQQTNISSSVDKILDDEVPVVTHRILAFLLLGIVRIYSKKVEYLCHDCHVILNRLCGSKTGKNTPAGIGVSRRHYHSISLPTRFELDRFDLDLLEDQHVACGNVGSKDTLADGHRKDGSTSGLLYKDSLRHLLENIPISEAHLKAYTPPRDVFGPHHMDQDLFICPSKNKNISLAGMEVLRGTRLSLQDRLGLNLLDEVEEEQMHNKLADEEMTTNFQVPSHMESESVLSPSYNRSHLFPSLEISRGTGFALEDRLEPMELDEAEKEQLNERPFNGSLKSNLPGPMEEMELEFFANQSPKGTDSIASLGIRNDGRFSLEKFTNFKMSNDAEMELGHDKTSDKEHGLEEEHAEHLSTQLNFHEGEHGVEEEHAEHLSTRMNFHEGEHCDFIGSVDKAMPADAKMKQLEVINPVNVNCQRLEEFYMSIVPTNSKHPAAGVGTPDVVTVQTPGRKERAKILKKRKILFDSSTVVPNRVFKNWTEDPTDLKRERRKVPRTLLDAWRAHKFAHLPQSILEPLIPGVSVDLGYPECNRSCAPATKSVELSTEQDATKSPVTYGAREQIPEVRPPVTEKSPGQTPDVGSPVTEKSPDQTPIAPGTPVAHLDPLRTREARAVTDSDILGPTTSFESIEKGPSSNERLEFDVLFQEETSSFEVDSLEKDAYSERTRMMGCYLGRKFLDKKRRKEEEVLNLSHLLAGKTKKESARLFYEILVLKTRDCIEVQQEIAYHDILLRETTKLRQVSDT